MNQEEIGKKGIPKENTLPKNKERLGPIEVSAFKEGMKKVMTIGVFDSLTEKESDFLKKAKKYGDYLIIIVLKNNVAERLDGKPPKNDLEARILRIQSRKIGDLIIAGSDKVTSWKVIIEHRPDIIVLPKEKKDLLMTLETYLLESNLPTRIKSIT